MDTSPPLAPDTRTNAVLALIAAARARAADDPFSNPVLSTARILSRQIDDGTLSDADLAALVAAFRDAAMADRARRLATYVGGTDPAGSARVLAAAADRLIPPEASLDDARALARSRFGLVLTAHPTFATASAVYGAIAGRASDRPAAPTPASHRPPRPTLDDEFAAAAAALDRGRDALDLWTAAILDRARDRWAADWTSLDPCPIVLASWVGFDTDGRTDIGWHDSIRYRLELKRLGLARLARQVAGTGPLLVRVDQALQAVAAQLAAVPARADPDSVAPFARALIATRDAALLSPAPLLPLFADAIARAETQDDAKRLVVARASLVGHGISLARAHVRLNAAQIHNAARIRLGVADPPADRSRRRLLLAAIDDSLGQTRPEPVDFGALIAEQASAARLMMLVAQIAKHVDSYTPTRFLIAETETGYTLLAALWLARLFGVERHVEISPLFETAEALQAGERILDEALRSRHYRAYVRRLGRVCLQFGYSDSGRYVGQLPASYLIERLKLRLADTLRRHGLAGVEIVLFDTHGESIGRGAHPDALAARLDYLDPPAARAALATAGFATRAESSAQGGDGYLLLGTAELALATVARIAEHIAEHVAATDTPTDPIYDEPDFAAGFFATITEQMRALLDDPGYAALLGVFGPAFLDPTGSRPAARQSDTGGRSVIQHPRQLRAIPNNAVLHGVGWCANTLHGVGEAAGRDPDTFADLRARSARFRAALDFVRHAARHSDIDVLRAVIALLDPGSWLDRAAQATVPGRAERLASIAQSLADLNLWPPLLATARRAQADLARLRLAWPDLPRMSDRAVALHALRISVIGRIWLLATDIPDFSPRFAATPDSIRARLLRLDVPATLDLLAAIFPASAGAVAAEDYGEPPGPRGHSYAAIHASVFEPMRRLWDVVREITVAIAHEVGAFG